MGKKYGRIWEVCVGVADILMIFFLQYVRDVFSVRGISDQKET